MPSAHGIDDLLRRGAEAYAAFIRRTYTQGTTPVGTVRVVTRHDFELHPGTCLDYIGPDRVLHVLDASGRIFALLSTHDPSAARVRP